MRLNFSLSRIYQQFEWQSKQKQQKTQKQKPILILIRPVKVLFFWFFGPSFSIFSFEYIFTFHIASNRIESICISTIVVSHSSFDAFWELWDSNEQSYTNRNRVNEKNIEKGNRSRRRRRRRTRWWWWWWFELVYNFMLQLLMHISVYCHYHVQLLIPSACVRPVKIVVSVCGFTIFLLADIYLDFLAVFRP